MLTCEELDWTQASRFPIQPQSTWRNAPLTKIVHLYGEFLEWPAEPYGQHSCYNFASDDANVNCYYYRYSWPRTAGSKRSNCDREANAQPDWTNHVHSKRPDQRSEKAGKQSYAYQRPSKKASVSWSFWLAWAA
jgi:hypothetical protein